MAGQYPDSVGGLHDFMFTVVGKSHTRRGNRKERPEVLEMIIDSFIARQERGIKCVHTLITQLMVICHLGPI